MWRLLKEEDIAGNGNARSRVVEMCMGMDIEAVESGAGNGHSFSLLSGFLLIWVFSFCGAGFFFSLLTAIASFLYIELCLSWSFLVCFLCLSNVYLWSAASLPLIWLGLVGFLHLLSSYLLSSWSLCKSTSGFILLCHMFIFCCSASYSTRTVRYLPTGLSIHCLTLLLSSWLA